MDNNKRISTSNILVKECIVSALLQLIKEKPLSSISISELCKKAGVSRMAFYRNYESKEDIFKKHLSEVFEEYKNDDTAHNITGMYCDRLHLRHYFDYIYKHRYFLDGLLYCGFDVIFLNMLNEYILDKWKDQSDKYILTAFAGSLYNTFHLWSVSNYTEDIETLCSIIEKIYNK